LDASVASLRRWVAANLPEEALRSRVRVPRPPAPPGSEGQIDYGRLGRWTDPSTGKTVTVWAFVMVLACSRHTFVRPTIRMDQEAWTRAHVEAFAFFGGAPARLVPDNLKTGVDRPDLYDPKLNRSYGELAEHYGVLIDPARAARPRDKPKVERAMPYVRDSFWRGRDFTSLAQMRDAAEAWCRDVAGRRQHRGLDGAAPLSVFTAVEANALSPLPRRVFTLATWSRGKVGPDIHVKVGPALYSVPWRLIGQHVDARSTATSVQIVHDGKVVATHLRAERGRRTTTDHYPPEKIAFHLRTPTWCREVAAAVGPACTKVIAGLLVDNALFRLRAAQGVLGLRTKHGHDRLESACAAALAAGDPSYRTIKGILAVSDRTDPVVANHTRPAGTSAAVPAFLRGQDQLFADPAAHHDGVGNVVHLPTPSINGTTSANLAGTTTAMSSEREAAR
jgi:transposase